MQLIKENIHGPYKFDGSVIEKVLVRENKFINELFEKLPKTNIGQHNDSDEEMEVDHSKTNQNPADKNKKSRAKTLVELQKRLDEIRKNRTLSYKQKLLKKTLKNKIKKKGKQDERNVKKKLIRAQDIESKSIHNSKVDTEAIPNSSNATEESIAYSKFNFPGTNKKNKHKEEKDPRKILENLKKQKEHLRTLEVSGETEKVVQVKDKIVWKNAFAKAEGQKVKDDPELLKKSVKKMEQQQRKSKKKWAAREESVAKAKDERQKKRTENIDKRKQQKKNNKLKKASKRGRIIPGF